MTKRKLVVIVVLDVLATVGLAAVWSEKILLSVCAACITLLTLVLIFAVRQSK
jgi:hypothetical protein